MRSKGILLIFLYIGLIILGACGSKKPEEATNVLLDSLVYDKHSEKLPQMFNEGVELKDFIVEIDGSFSDDFTSTYVIKDDVVNDYHLKMEEFGDIWRGKTKEITSYKIKKISVNRKIVTAEYEIKGVDLVDCYRTMLREVINKIKQDRTLVINQEKLQNLMLDELINAMKKGKVVEEPTEISVSVLRQRTKFSIILDDQFNMQEAYLNFLTGQKNEITLNQEIEKINDEIENELRSLIND